MGFKLLTKVVVESRHQISSSGQPLTESVFHLAPSLAELRERTIERGEDSEKTDSASERPLTTPSAVCAQSVISAFPPEQIQRLIQEVKDLDEDTLKVTCTTMKCYLHKLQAFECSIFHPALYISCICFITSVLHSGQHSG